MFFALAAAVGNLQAQAPCSPGMAYFLGYPYDQFRLQNIPFYSLYPPVYYSQPVARPYGYSPFAYPPGFTTPEPVAVEAPKVMVNPHVPSAQPTKSSVAALRIVNPHVQQVALVEPAPAVTKETSAVVKEASEAAQSNEVVKDVAETEPLDATGVTALNRSDLFGDLD
jgi:hypothetical protein